MIRHSPDNIYPKTLGFQKTHVCANPANMNTLINFVADLLNDNAIGSDLEKLFKHDKLVASNTSRVEIAAKIITPGLKDKLMREARKLGSREQSHEICYQCPMIFIGDLFEELEKRRITLPSEVHQFYEALTVLSAWCIDDLV